MATSSWGNTTGPINAAQMSPEDQLYLRKFMRVAGGGGAGLVSQLLSGTNEQVRNSINGVQDALVTRFDPTSYNGQLKPYLTQYLQQHPISFQGVGGTYSMDPNKLDYVLGGGAGGTNANGSHGPQTPAGAAGAYGSGYTGYGNSVMSANGPASTTPTTPAAPGLSVTGGPNYGGGGNVPPAGAAAGGTPPPGGYYAGMPQSGIPPSPMANYTRTGTYGPSAPRTPTAPVGITPNTPAPGAPSPTGPIVPPPPTGFRGPATIARRTTYTVR